MVPTAPVIAKARPPTKGEKVAAVGYTSRSSSSQLDAMKLPTLSPRDASKDSSKAVTSPRQGGKGADAARVAPRCQLFVCRTSAL